MLVSFDEHQFKYPPLLELHASLENEQLYSELVRTVLARLKWLTPSTQVTPDGRCPSATRLGPLYNLNMQLLDILQSQRCFARRSRWLHRGRLESDNKTLLQPNIKIEERAFTPPRVLFSTQTRTKQRSYMYRFVACDTNVLKAVGLTLTNASTATVGGGIRMTASTSWASHDQLFSFVL